MEITKKILKVQFNQNVTLSQNKTKQTQTSAVSVYTIPPHPMSSLWTLKTVNLSVQG